MIEVKIIVAKGCGCSKREKINIIFPIGVTKEFISKCKKAGFQDDPRYTERGLLYIKKGNVSISGSLCLKHATLACSTDNCKEEINKVVSELEVVFKEMGI